MDFKNEMRSLINVESAKWIRNMRVDEGYSFRAIAEACSKKWVKDWGSNQFYGEDLCALAIEVLNDKPENGWQ